MRKICVIPTINGKLNFALLIVLPDQLSISSATEAFDANGKLKDEAKTKQLKAIARALTQTLQKLKS